MGPPHDKQIRNRQRPRVFGQDRSCQGLATTPVVPGQVYAVAESLLLAKRVARGSGLGPCREGLQGAKNTSSEHAPHTAVWPDMRLATASRRSARIKKGGVLLGTASLEPKITNPQDLVLGV